MSNMLEQDHGLSAEPVRRLQSVLKTLVLGTAALMLAACAGSNSAEQ